MDSESAVKLRGDNSTDLNVSITDWRSIPCLGNVEGDKVMDDHESDAPPAPPPPRGEHSPLMQGFVMYVPYVRMDED